MKSLIVLAVACVVAVSSLPPPPSCHSPPVPVPAVHAAAGSSFLKSNYDHAATGVHGSHFNAAAGSSHFDKKEDHQKTKQVIESESSSKHIKGGSNFGIASGGSHGAYSSHGHGSTVAGSQYQQVAHL